MIHDTRAVPTDPWHVEEALPLARLKSASPVVFGKDASYEWFYVEIDDGNNRIICILSLVDPFLPAAASQSAGPGIQEVSAPPSAYVTWHRRGRDGFALVGGSYSVFEGPAARDFTRCVTDFMTGESRVLALDLPCLSLRRLLSLELARPDFGTGKPAPSLHDEGLFGKKHVWQLLLADGRISGRIGHRVLQRSTHEDGLRLRGSFGRAGRFFDVPRARRLARVPAVDEILNDARCYFDHNAGREPLTALAEPWFWWHAREKRGPEPARWQVGYAFPRADAAFLCEGSGHAADERLREGVGRTRIAKGLASAAGVGHLSRGAFGVQAPRSVDLGQQRCLPFDRVLESAPFYLRMAGGTNPPDGSTSWEGTLESLEPRALGSALCQRLIRARQIIVRSGYEPRPLASQASFEALCRLITSRHGKSFFLASHVLGRRERARAYFVYALCRLIDDATDARAATEDTDRAGSAQSRALLDALFDAPGRARSSQGVGHGARHGSGCGCGLASDDRTAGLGLFLAHRLSTLSCRALSVAAIPAFLDFARASVRESGLEKAHFLHLLEGQRADESFARPSSFEDFYRYCFQVAGAIGLIMARVLGAPRTPMALRAAEHLGIAMQMTNILRDVREDFERGRIYLPGADASGNLGAAVEDGLRESRDVTNVLTDAAVRAVAKDAAHYYASALEGVPAIPTFRGRACVRVMVAVYGAILGRILCAPHAVFAGRVVVPGIRRIGLALAALCGRPPLVISGMSAGLESGRSDQALPLLVFSSLPVRASTRNEEFHSATSPAPSVSPYHAPAVDSQSAPVSDSDLRSWDRLKMDLRSAARAASTSKEKDNT